MAALLDLLWSDPTSMIPTREAVMKWRAMLAYRGPEFASLVTEITDKASGKDTQRPGLERLLAFVRESDTVVVHSMDRLVRNLDDLRPPVLAAGSVFHR